MSNRFAALNSTPEPPTIDVTPGQPDRAPKAAKQAKPAAAPKVAKAKAWTHGEGKSSQENYERLTVYVPKTIKQDLERSLVGTGQNMSDIVSDLLTRHLHA